MYKRLERIELIITGNVQGVGFRYAAREKAQELGIVLREATNMPDGRTLRLAVEGEEEPLQKFSAWARVGPEFADVKHIEVEEV